MKRLSAVLVFLICTIALAGCGGGGGGSASIATGNVSRQLQVGDRVVYTVTGTTRASITGTATMVVSDASDLEPLISISGRLLKVATSYNLSVDGKETVYTSTMYEIQTTDGTLYYYGSSDANGNVLMSSCDHDPVDIPSPINVGNTWTYTAQFNDNTSSTDTCSVLALESVSGRMAYKIEDINQDSSDGGSSSTNYKWFVPDLGIPVKLTGSVQYTDGTYLDLTLLLQSKNF